MDCNRAYKWSLGNTKDPEVLEILDLARMTLALSDAPELIEEFYITPHQFQVLLRAWNAEERRCNPFAFNRHRSIDEAVLEVDHYRLKLRIDFSSTTNFL